MNKLLTNSLIWAFGFSPNISTCPVRPSPDNSYFMLSIYLSILSHSYGYHYSPDPYDLKSLLSPKNSFFSPSAQSYYGVRTVYYLKHGLFSQTAQISIPALLLTSCLPSGKLLVRSETLFPHLYNYGTHLIDCYEELVNFLW